MGANSQIAWTHHTFNAWWGCTKVSEACRNCYAERDARRFGFPGRWDAAGTRRFFGEEHWRQPLLWNRRAEQAGAAARVFAGSMCDIFEDREDVAGPRNRLFDLIESTRFLNWLLLTKRPQNIARMLPASWLAEPRRNVWLLATAGDQEEADRNIEALVQVPAVVHGVSCEPLLGNIDLSRWLCHDGISCKKADWLCRHDCPDNRLQWIIGGGESGPHARPTRLDWARALRDQAGDSEVPFFWKHWGEYNAAGDRVGRKAAGDLLDGQVYHEIPEVE